MKGLAFQLARGMTSLVPAVLPVLLLKELFLERTPSMWGRQPVTRELLFDLGREMTSPVQVVSMVLPLEALGFERQAVAAPGVRPEGT
jgi:hypothetical protein